MTKKNKKQKNTPEAKTQAADARAQATNLLEHPCNENCKKNRLFDFD